MYFQSYYEQGQKERAVETMTKAFTEHPDQITSEGRAKIVKT